VTRTKISHRKKNLTTAKVIAVIAMLICFSGFFVPFYYNIYTQSGWTIGYIFNFGITSVSIMMICMLALPMVICFINFFVKPGWTSYFVCGLGTVILCVAPVYIYYTLVTKLNISFSNLILHTGAYLVILASLMFAGVEIYRLSTVGNDKYKIKKLKHKYYCYKLETRILKKSNLLTLSEITRKSK